MVCLKYSLVCDMTWWTSPHSSLGPLCYKSIPQYLLPTPDHAPKPVNIKSKTGKISFLHLEIFAFGEQWFIWPCKCDCRTSGWKGCFWRFFIAMMFLSRFIYKTMPSLEPSLSPGNFTNLTLVQCTFTHWGCLSDKLKGGHASKSNIPSHHWYSNNWNPFTCTKKEKQHFPSKDSQAYSLLEERIFEEWLEFTKTTIGLCCWQIFNQIQLHLNDVWSDKIQGWPACICRVR